MPTKLSIYQRVATLVGQGLFATITDDTELRYVLDEIYADSVDYLLREAPWRFALKEATLSSSGTPTAGYTTAYDLPPSHFRTHSVFVADTERHGDLPIDCRLQSQKIYANYSGDIHITYTSASGRTEADWPEGFTETICAYLAFQATQRITQLNGRTNDLFSLYERMLQAAAERECVPESPWLVHQFDGSFISSVRYVLTQGAWKFATVTDTIAESGTPIDGFTYAFPKPSDWAHTHAVFIQDSAGRELPIDAREDATSYAADVDEIMVRYVSEDVVQTPTTWPEQFLRSVASHLGIDFGDQGERRDQDGNPVRQMLWPDYIQRALQEHALPPNRWLPFQLDGSFARAAAAMLEKAHWRFALASSSITGSATGDYDGYAYNFAFPADHVRTQGLYVLTSGGEERPADIRESGDSWSCDTTPVVAHYTSASLGNDVTLWPLDYLELVYHFMTGSESWPEMFLATSMKLAVDDSPWLQHQLSGAFLRSVKFIASKITWRFALESVTLDTTAGTPLDRFTYRYAKPADWIKTHSVRVHSGVDELPVDVREHETGYSTDADEVVVRYVSSTSGYSPTLWPEAFIRCVGSHLGIDMGDGGVQRDESGRAQRTLLWPEYLSQAEVDFGVAPDRWYPFQIDGTFHRTQAALLEKAHWRFAQKSSAITGSATGDYEGYAYKFTIPADHVRTRGLFQLTSGGEERPADIREEGGTWSANATPIAAHFTSSTLGYDATLWPSDYLELVHAYLVGAEDREARLALVMREHSVPESPWLVPQLDGSLLRSVMWLLNKVTWQFSLTSDTFDTTAGTPLDGFTYRYAHPADWIKTHAIFILSGDDELPVDVREHEGAWSTDADEIVVRYVSTTTGTDATKWPESFIRCLGSHLGLDMGDGGVQRDENGRPQREMLWPQYLEQAQLDYGVRPNKWLSYQLDGSFHRAQATVLTKAFWRFAQRSNTISGTATGAYQGYDYDFEIPADHVRTRGLFRLTTGGDERPDDIREEGDSWSANIAQITAHYTSSTEGYDVTLWPSEYLDLVYAYLTQMEGWFDLLQVTASNLAIPESRWLQYQLNGTFVRMAAALLEKAHWRFAQESATLSGSATGDYPGYAYNFDLPADHVRTRGLFIVSGTSEYPADIRESNTKLSAHVDSVAIHYTSSTLGFNTQRWPLDFLSLLWACLTEAEGYNELVDLTAAKHAVMESPWLPYQLDGTFAQKADALLTMAHWRFAQDSATITGSAPGVHEGYAYHFDLPADHVRTRALLVVSGSEEYPADIRVNGTELSAQVATITVQYTSSTPGRDPTLWPREYTQLLWSFLSGDEVFYDKLQVVANDHAVREDKWLPYQLDGSFPRQAGALLQRAHWRFAQESATLSGTAPGVHEGYAYHFDLPADHVRTRALLVTASNAEYPADVRISGDELSAQVASITIHYTSSTRGADVTLWPRDYLDLLWAQISGAETFQDLLQVTSARIAIPEDKWLFHQLDGSFMKEADALLQRAHWRFAQKSTELTGSATGAYDGYLYHFDLPADHVRTRGLFVVANGEEHPADIRESGVELSANLEDIVVHYTSSTLGRDVTLWPRDYLSLLWSQISGSETYAEQLAEVSRKLAVTESPWLKYQFNGAFPTGVRSLMWEQDWRWATSTEDMTVTEEADGTYIYTKPSDWGTTVRVMDANGKDIAYQERGGAIVAEVTPITWEYISIDAIEDPTQWPEYFDTALLTWLTLMDGAGDPATPGAVIQARRGLFEDRMRQTRKRDDQRDRPKMNRAPGRFVQARRSWGSLSSYYEDG